MNKELKKLLENAGMHEVEINEDYNEAGIDKLEQKIMIMITRFARSIKTLKSNAYDVYGLDDPEEVNSIIEQMIYEFLDDKLSENIIEANPDGSISQGEDERRANFLDMFEFALDELLGKAMAEAHEIGGQFRSPGIKAQIRKMLAFKARSL